MGDLSSDEECDWDWPCILHLYCSESCWYRMSFAILLYWLLLIASLVFLDCYPGFSQLFGRFQRSQLKNYRHIGETKLMNEEGSWWTMIQVYEYYISQLQNQILSRRCCSYAGSWVWRVLFLSVDDGLIRRLITFANGRFFRNCWAFVVFPCDSLFCLVLSE